MMLPYTYITYVVSLHSDGRAKVLGPLGALGGGKV